MANIFDERGVIVQGIDEIRTTMSEEAKIKFADKTDGAPLRTDDSSILGRIFALTAKPAVENGDILPLIFSAFDPNSVEGDQQDNLFGNFWRVPRKNSSQSTGLLMLYGTIGTLVARGSEVGNVITGDAYQIDNDVTFGTSTVNGVDVEISTVSGTYTINYTVDGYLSQSAPISITTSVNDTTVRNIAERLVDAVNSQSSYLTATRNNDNTVKIIITDQSRTGNFSTVGNMSIVRSYSPVYATSVTYNSRESLTGQISSIRTSVGGWISVTNPFTIFASQPIESNEDYRYRAKLTRTGKSTSKYNSILMALKSVRGVTYENVQANTSQNTTGSGITNNGISVTVMGGNEDEIALALFNSVSEGIGMVGNITKQVSDINGFPHIVNFSRPVSKAIKISMSLVVFPDFPSNGIALIKQALVDYFNNLNVGEDIYYSRLYEPINSIRGFSIRNLKIGLSGGTLGAEDIVLGHNELATINADDISIGGN